MGKDRFPKALAFIKHAVGMYPFRSVSRIRLAGNRPGPPGDNRQRTIILPVLARLTGGCKSEGRRSTRKSFAAPPGIAPGAAAQLNKTAGGPKGYRSQSNGSPSRAAVPALAVERPATDHGQERPVALPGKPGYAQVRVEPIRWKGQKCSPGDGRGNPRNAGGKRCRVRTHRPPPLPGGVSRGRGHAP